MAKRTLSPSSASDKESLSDANQCIAIGFGVGGLGTAASLVLGATCPLCFVVTPALIGTGLFQRFRTKRKIAENTASGTIQNSSSDAPKRVF